MGLNCFKVRVDVCDVLHELIGEISSSDELECVDELEKYLIQSSFPQVMARTKQMQNKTDSKGQLVSPGGEIIAMKSPRRSPQKNKGQGHDTNRTGFPSENSEGEMSRESSRSKRRATEDPNPGSKKRARLASKELQKAKPMKKPTMRELCVNWNRSARTGLNTETVRGWLKTGERKQNEQGRLLCRAIPGGKALWEIKHYQRCQAFLVPQLPFHHLVREICDNEPLCTRTLRWQANALFTLQCATEAYMAGFLMDVNLCTLHRRVVTIDRKDIWLAIQIRGREHVGGKRNVSDTGTMNPSKDWMSDPSEMRGWEKRRGCHFEYQSTPLADWNEDL